jgi:hypothetical protein
LRFLYFRRCGLSRILAPTKIPSIYPRESGSTGFPACADNRLNLINIILIFFNKEHLEKLRVTNTAPNFNTHLHRLESLCHQPKMNFAGASMVMRNKADR